VRDQGVGIPEADLPRIFERFFRARTSTGIVGTGIGLYSVKRLVAMHGGTVEVESAEGEGTTVIVRLPVAPPQRGNWAQA
jgi:signal transduction histidine kinase